MTPEELKAEFNDLVNYYYDEMSECKTLSDLYKLNWVTKDKGINLMFKAFNETWEQGWDTIKGRKDSD
jgi:hypothetical protein